MTRGRGATAAVLLLLVAAALDADDLTRAPAPGWVTREPWTPPEAPPGTGSDYEDLFRDYQVNTVTGERYVHLAFRFLTARAVQNDSTVRIGYDPEYQKVSLNTLTLWRAGQAVDQRSISFRSLQREKRLEESLYDGEQTWVGFLKDVRPGDVLEIAYTTQGNNPSFAGRYADRFVLETAYPVGLWSLRVLAPRGRGPDVRAFGTAPPARAEAWGDLDQTSVRVGQVPAAPTEENLPGDTLTEGRYVLSDWKTWGDVARWALPQYAVQTDPAVSEKARQLTAGLTGPDRKAEAILAFVQDGVRYLGIETGSNSHRPHPAAEVLGNGFGDCKDKAVLFCSLAAAAGLEAWPILVHSRGGDLVRLEGPTPLSFNHVIVGLSLGGRTLFLDPTADQQGGSLESRSRGPFVWGLEVRAGTEDLTAIPPPPAGTRTLVQTFRFPGFEAEAGVTMDFTFTGPDADDQRRRTDGADEVEWKKSIDEWLHDRYGDARLSSGPVRTDDRAANTFRVSYEFRLKGHWTKDGEVYKAEFYPTLVGQNLYDPDSVGARTQPYALEHPVTVRQVRRLEVPGTWDFAPEEGTVAAPGFSLKYAVRVAQPGVVEMTDEFVSLADRVAPADWSEYLEKLDAARQAVNWTLTHRVEAAPAAAPAGPGAMAQITAVTTSVVLFFLYACLQGADF